MLLLFVEILQENHFTQLSNIEILIAVVMFSDKTSWL